VPALIPAREDTEQFFLQGDSIDTGNGLVILFGGGDAEKKVMHKAAVQFQASERKLKWVHAENNDFGGSLAKSVGLEKESFPEVVIWEFGETEEDDKVFRLSLQEGGGGIKGQAIEALISKWKLGSLSAEKDPVVAVTSQAFEKIVIDNDRDVFVEFYAPWCGHCKSLAPTYKQLAQHYANDPEISIVKVDATKHSHASAEVKSYPTLKFYRKGKKAKPKNVGEKVGRDKQSLIDFIEKYRTSSSSGAKSKKDDAASSQPAETLQTSTGPSADASMNIWAFDDPTDPTSRGKSLSADMIASKAGFTLVGVGNLGILISPNGTPRAVRQFASATEAQRHAAEVSAVAPSAKSSTAPPSSTFPCPNDADMDACQKWCNGISLAEMPLTATFAGKICSDLPAGSKPLDWPQCMCYDTDFTELFGSCRSTCSGKASGGKGSK